MFDNRFSWSGEIPLNFPGLNPKALQRITPSTGVWYNDAVTTSRRWERIPGGANDGYAAGQFGLHMGLNTVNPATDKGQFKLANFAGLWPSSGKVLAGLWVAQRYTMSFNPLISTRGGSSPLLYLSTSNSGRLRHQVYGAGGALVLDQYEDHPWKATTGYQFVGMLLDMTAQTSQMFSVEMSTKRSWVGPVRALSGAPLANSTADVDVFSLQTANYWTGGTFDEAVIAHPSASFNLSKFVDSMALGLYSDGQTVGQVDHFAVTDAGIKAATARSFSTGAERVQWDRQPIIQGLPAGSTAYWSTDNGATWQTGNLPNVLDGLLRFVIPLGANQTFSGITITVPTEPPPTLAPIADRVLLQGDIVNIPLDYFAFSAPRWTVDAPPMVSVTITDGVMSVAGGFRVGAGEVTVTLRDELDRAVSRSFTVTINPRQWDDPEQPEWAHSPIVVWGETLPEAVIGDPDAAVVTREVNGEERLDFTISANHKHARKIQNERYVEVSGEKYRVRRATTARRGGLKVLEVYAEAEFYDLATASKIPKREWKQATAGDVMTFALRGTGWRVAVANVTTLRTYEHEDTNPLELLRLVQENHGGDLVFDNKAKTVSLVTKSGKDQGVAFFYGKGLSESQKIVDTTSLVTRLYAVNADGQTIASVNNGKAYLEDFSYTDDVKIATYEFKAGVTPFQMLDLAKATLAKRARPEYSYEVKVEDLSVRSGAQFDRFGLGDMVTVVDNEINLSTTQRIVRLEYDIVRPWDSEVTLSAILREAGGADQDDAGTLKTGATVSTFDLVPFNLLLNGRFDNGLAHWANFGATVVEGGVTGDYAVSFSGSGERWIEQTVQPDNRTAYALSFDMEANGPNGWVPNVKAEAVVTYEDGSSETITIDLVQGG